MSQVLKFLFLIIFFLISAVINEADSSRILCLYPGEIKSHLIVTKSLMKGLAEAGHNITVVSSFPRDTPIKNYRDIYVPLTDLHLELVAGIIKKLETGSQFAYISFLRSINKLDLELSEQVINFPEFRKVIDEETFDLLIVGSLTNKFMYGLSAHFGCPIVFLAMGEAEQYLNKYMGNPLEISHVPTPFSEIKGQMSFFARVEAFLLMAFEEVMSFFNELDNEVYYEKFFPAPKYPVYTKIRSNISLAFVNHHFSQGNVRACVPAIIEVGGIQIKEKPSPLPDDIQKWMDESTDGAIFFSLGSNFKSADLNKNQLEVLLRVFDGLKERVLWKFENETLPGLPSNVKIGKWLPQDDILAHPNLKLFITHGGLGSVAEARFHGVPLVTLPIFADQHSNAVSVEREGWSITVNFYDLTVKSLSFAINEVLQNPKYSTNAREWSLLYRDRPMTAIKTAIWWIEYVIRHRGATHMRSNAVHFNLFQLFSFDVVVAFAVMLYAAMKMFSWLVAFLLRSVKGKTIKNKHE